MSAWVSVVQSPQYRDFRQGLELLLGEAAFWELVTLVLEAGQGQRHAPTDVRDRWSEAGLVRLKAAIWGVANAATSPSASKPNT